ncbi:MAG: RNA-binding protein [Pseudomonadales bacterium]|nr:RNA-binding protein [Pseudomonadales bacterium]
MSMEKVRLDKWLWAARFYKTRAKAKIAIDGGKIHMNGVRCKPAKEIQIADEIQIRQNLYEISVQVTGLSSQRRGAPEAQLLYQETESSIENRTSIVQQRKASGINISSTTRPTKKGRRQIHKFREQQN